VKKRKLPEIGTGNLGMQVSLNCVWKRTNGNKNPTLPERNSQSFKFKKESPRRQ